jgi:hypothetical protein
MASSLESLRPNLPWARMVVEYFKRRPSSSEHDRYGGLPQGRCRLKPVAFGDPCSSPPYRSVLITGRDEATARLVEQSNWNCAAVPLVNNALALDKHRPHTSHANSQSLVTPAGLFADPGQPYRQQPAGWTQRNRNSIICLITALAPNGLLHSCLRKSMIFASESSD